MRKTIISTLLCVGFMLSSCNQGNKNSSQAIEKDTIANRDNNLKKDLSIDKSKDETVDRNNVVHFNPIKVDTIIGDIHISYKIQDDNQVIATYPITDGKGQDTAYYANREIVLTISKEGKNIFSDRKIERTDFISYIPQNEISKYCISYFKIASVSPNDISFSISFCVPDTDVCYWFELHITNDGQTTIKEVVEEESDM